MLHRFSAWVGGPLGWLFLAVFVFLAIALLLAGIFGHGDKFPPFIN